MASLRTHNLRTDPSEKAKNQVHYRIIDERTQPKLDAHNPELQQANVEGGDRDPLAAITSEGGNRNQSNLAGDEVELVPTPESARAKASQRLLDAPQNPEAQQRIGHNVTIAMQVPGSNPRMDGMLRNSLTRARMSLEKARVTGRTY